MRISDGSSDVCSSDLEEIAALRGLGVAQARLQLVQAADDFVAVRDQAGVGDQSLCAVQDAAADPDEDQGSDQQAEAGSFLDRLHLVAGNRAARPAQDRRVRSEEHTSELPSLIRISYAVFRLNKK